jgi:hypothetical protein
MRRLKLARVVKCQVEEEEEGSSEFDCSLKGSVKSRK